MNPKISRRVLSRTIAAGILDDPRSIQKWLKRTAAYLVEYNRVQEVDLLVNDIAHELQAQSGKLLVDVTSARRLSESVKTELKHLLHQSTGAKSVDLTEHIDPSLLGGLVVRTPDAQLDVSIRSKLKQLATIN